MRIPKRSPDQPLFLSASRIFALLISMTILLGGSSLAVASEPTAIRDMTPAEIQGSEPTLHEKYFRDGNPRGYIRHRLVHIDTATLKSQLRADHVARTNNETPDGVFFPLFPDRDALVVVDDWMEGNFGVTSVYGTIQNPDGLALMFSAHFSDSGRIEASFSGRETGVLVTHLQDFAHYVVLELEYPDRTD